MNKGSAETTVSVRSRPRRTSERKRVRFSAAEARRIALAAQGFAVARPHAPSRRHLRTLLKRLGLVQIDSVNVLVRAHYMPLFSRLGPYPTTWLDEAAYHARKRQLFEYWGHEASLIRLDLLSYLGWRMRKSATGKGVWTSVRSISKEQPELLRRIETEIRDRGPMSAGQLEKILLSERRTTGWWGWSECKRAVEWLFWVGRLTTANRRNFERVYDLTERVFPNFRPEEISEAEGHRVLIGVAAKALGVATAVDLRDYFRLEPEESRQAIDELVTAGELIQVEVDGWSQPALLDPNAQLPRQLEIKALVSPFDPLLWDRRRAERLFGFRYRIEIYTPAHKREHGYYVVPFLLRDAFVARVDLQADRATGTLRVLSSHYEPTARPEEIVGPLHDELGELAKWLRLERIAVSKRGNLARALGAMTNGR
jgi:uncharacterized protein